MSRDQSGSPTSDPSSSHSLLPSRLDGQRHVQALREAILLLDQLQHHGQPLDQVRLRLLHQAQIRLTFSALHLSPRSDCLDLVGIHERAVEALRLRVARLIR